MPLRKFLIYLAVATALFMVASQKYGWGWNPFGIAAIAVCVAGIAWIIRFMARANVFLENRLKDE